MVCAGGVMCVVENNTCQKFEYNRYHGVMREKRNNYDSLIMTQKHIFFF